MGFSFDVGHLVKMSDAYLFDLREEQEDAVAGCVYTVIGTTASGNVISFADRCGGSYTAPASHLAMLTSAWADLSEVEQKELLRIFADGDEVSSGRIVLCDYAERVRFNLVLSTGRRVTGSRELVSDPDPLAHPSAWDLSVSSTLTIDRGYREAGPLPVFEQYAGQTTPQPAFLELDIDGTVRVDYSGEIGNAIPMRVYRRLALRWDIPCTLTVPDIDRLLSDATPLLTQLYSHYTEDWDGCNRVGRLDRGGSIVEGALKAMLADFPDADSRVCDALDWCAQSIPELRDEYADATDKDAYFTELRDEVWARQMVWLTNLDALRRAVESDE